MPKGGFDHPQEMLEQGWEAPNYECRCAECDRSFFADSKNRILCPSCKRATAQDRGECPECGALNCQTNH